MIATVPAIRTPLFANKGLRRFFPFFKSGACLSRYPSFRGKGVNTRGGVFSVFSAAPRGWCGEGLEGGGEVSGGVELPNLGGQGIRGTGPLIMNS